MGRGRLRGEAATELASSAGMRTDEERPIVPPPRWRRLSLRRLVEGSLVVLDRELAARLERSYVADLGHAREIRDARRRTLWRRLARTLTVRAGRV
jgi:hypothetical protein